MIWNYRRSLMDEYDSPRWKERVRMMSDAQVFAIWTRMHSIRKNAARDDSIVDLQYIKKNGDETPTPSINNENRQISFYDLFEF